MEKRLGRQIQKRELAKQEQGMRLDITYTGKNEQTVPAKEESFCKAMGNSKHRGN